MKACVLISTMFCNDIEKLINQMNIQTDCVIVNQCDVNKETREELTIGGKNVIFISTNERGLSRSRNKALENVPKNVDVVIFTDDDIWFSDDYEKNILDVYADKTVDGCSFGVIRLNGKINKKLSKIINKITMLRVCSVSLTFRYNSIKNMRFDTDFGTGSGKYIMGEENIFVSDCLNNHLKLISSRYVMCEECNIRESTWYKGIDKEYLVSRGAYFKRIFPCVYWLFILDFAVRKNRRYRENISLFLAIKYMFMGSTQYKKEKNNGK